jgi:hypothetical protein
LHDHLHQGLRHRLTSNRTHVIADTWRVAMFVKSVTFCANTLGLVTGQGTSDFDLQPATVLDLILDSVCDQRIPRDPMLISSEKPADAVVVVYW